jgi:arylsulfatase A-like enzyme
VTPRVRNSLIAAGVAAAAVAAALQFWPRPGSGVAPVRAPGQEGAAPGAPEASARRPDLLLVVYDARRRDDFSFGPFGNKRGDTPFLAAFSREALLFEDAVSPGAWTAPVHASMFSGRSVCELGIDFYNPGYAAFDASHLSLAEALGMAGYQTVAWADHPYFFNRDTRVSLIRGFEQFDVINDFERYASHTNVGTPGGATERRYDLAGLPALGQAEIAAQLDGFKRGELRFDLARQADFDPATGLYFARLEDLYRDSAYFQKRYRDDFDAHVFAGTRTRPFFLFVNLHMCDVALPDPGLFSRWLLRTVLMNAQSRGIVPAAGGLASGLPELTPALQKQAFDNRFYDATFRALWEYLEKRGLTRNLVSVVTSDHGVSFGEKGESFHLHAGARAYEYISRVPLLVRFPAGSPLARWHGRRTDKVSLTDVFKTLVDLALGPGSFRADPPLRSRSLVERLERNEFDEVLVSESALVPDSYRVLPEAAGYSRAVYQGTLKLLEAPELYRMSRERVTGLSRIGPEAGESRLAPLLELYDLAADPHETRDLAAQRPEQVARLRRAAGDWSCSPLASSSARPEWDPEALKTLRALGYIH